MIEAALYANSISRFLETPPAQVLGLLSGQMTQDVNFQQSVAWQAEIAILQDELSPLETDGVIFLEFRIPRMGRRADVVIVRSGVVFVLEFKVGATTFLNADIRQTHDYALDLKNFHRGSHNKPIVPILVATGASNTSWDLGFAQDKVAHPICIGKGQIASVLEHVCCDASFATFDAFEWAASGYLPTPSIVEAAQALYANHQVNEIFRTEAGVRNIAQTSNELLTLIGEAKAKKQKLICFVTGVPGAGKTLVGLTLANTQSDTEKSEHAVFLSGNGPLVKVLQEALAIDKSQREGIAKSVARRATEQFIQNIHRFRDSALESSEPPPEHVVVFDEAQRAWNKEKTSKFMQGKRGQLSFEKSEPEFLIEFMDRHDWAVIVALVGGGQEINDGEAGLEGWLSALSDRFQGWRVCYSEELLSENYVTGDARSYFSDSHYKLPSLHLETSMRSFRAESVSSWVHSVIHNRASDAFTQFQDLRGKYDVSITRDLETAKRWIADKQRANERSGIVASSNGIRLRASGIYVKNEIAPEHWFLKSCEDIRSSNFLEDVATEFDVQGLELDWCLVAWDADFRYAGDKFEYWRFKGSKWQHRRKLPDQKFLENSYRVLLTRARQGMVIFVPEGDDKDPTRIKEFYDDTYAYLVSCGVTVL